jgi:hypothetical protein
MLIRIITLAIGAFIYVVGSALAQTPSSSTCGMAEPPKQAMRKTLVGGMVEIKYPDPTTVPANYTGCLNIWMEGVGDPVLTMVAKFKNGVAESVSVPPYGLNCEYKNNKLVHDPARLGTCLDAGDVTLDKWRMP